MAERSISVRVSAAVGGYVTSMQAAAAATKELGASTAAAAATNEKAFTRIGSGAAIGGALILASLGAAAKAAAEFDAQMSVVKANIDDKSAPSMKRLSDAALQAGSTTAYSATQAGKAEEELAKAGLSAADITGGALTAALNLASAGQLDLGDAAETTASTMVQFKLKASDAAHIADVLAAGADKSLGGVQDLSEALKYAGVPASQFGISLDSTVGVLAEFASNGITGSMAGTSLRQMLLSLASPTKEAQGVMDEYGISVFDASGKFVGLAGAAEQLKSKLGPLSQKQQQAALSSLFTARSVATANILMRGGAADVNKWTKAVNDQGFASQQASTKLDNLNGDLRKLKNTLNVDLIKAGQDATGALRGTAKGANFMAKAFGDLPGPAREVLTGLALVSGAGLLLIGTIGTAIPKVQNFRTSLESMGTAGAKVNSALGVVGKSLGIGIPLIGLGAAAWELWKQHTEAARRATEDMTQAIEADNGVIGENTNKLIAHGLQTSGAVDAAKRLKIPLQEVTEAILNGGPALDKLNSKLEQSGLDAARASLKHHDLGGQYAKNAGAAQTLKDAINGQNSTLEKAVHASKNDATAQKAVKAATDDATKSKKSAAQVTKDQVQAQKDLAKANASNPTYLLTGALLDLSPAAARSADKIKALSTALQQYNDLAYGSASASAAAGDALAALAKAKTANVNVDQILSDNLLSANDNTRTLAEQLGSTGDAYTKQLSQIYKDTAAQKGNNAAIIAVNKTHGQQVAALQRTLAKM
ncbi:MAG: phage tail tape measure protein, partial [Gaiellaceae bacterium]